MPLAAVLTGPQRLELQDRPPLRPGPGEVVVSVERAGICGTDLALFSGDYPVPLPRVCGHEFVGTVRALGEGVNTAWRGRHVTAEINNTCRALGADRPCTACIRGLDNHCLRRTVTGIIGWDGAFAAEMKVPAGCLHALPDTLDPEVAVLAEPLAAALQTFELSPPNRDDWVVLLGPGRLGILIAFVAARRGLKLLAVSRSEEKRLRALEFGAAEACTPEDAPSLVADRTGGLGADLVIDATGQPQGLAQAMALVRPCGTLAVKTTCGLPEKGLDLTQFVVNELRLQGSRCGPFPDALELLAEHQGRLGKLITCVRPLAEAPLAMELARREMKVVLETG